jgi:hypothetical protein
MRTNMPGTSAELGFTETTSNVECGADVWLNTSPAIPNQRIPRTSGLIRVSYVRLMYKTNRQSPALRALSNIYVE